MCQTVSGHHAGSAGSSCCCSGTLPQRCHFSREEKLEMLHDYEGELGKEIKGVRERIKELEKK